jgi:hypothetical protein
MKTSQPGFLFVEISGELQVKRSRARPLLLLLLLLLFVVVCVVGQRWSLQAGFWLAGFSGVSRVEVADVLCWLPFLVL